MAEAASPDSILRFVDTHCHLDFDQFDEDREDVIRRSQEAGVSQWMNPGVNLETSHRIVDLGHQLDGLYAAVGIHPTEAGKCSPADLKGIRGLAGDSKVMAIGEIGIDHYHPDTPADIQREYFIAQLEIAAELCLPVIIHSREAMDEVLEIIRSWHANLISSTSSLADRPGVLHSFEGCLEQAQNAIDLGFYIGVTGPVTFQNAPERRTLFQEIPLEHLLLETDAPFLTPHPYRGRRNEPAYIPLIAQTLAEIHQTNTAHVAEVTSDNADRLFAWRKPD